MSRDKLGSKPTLVLHNCVFRDERYHLVIKSHRQTVGYIKSKRQKRKMTRIAKQKQIFTGRFSKTGNTVSELDTNAIQELQDLKDSIDKTTQ